MCTFPLSLTFFAKDVRLKVIGGSTICKPASTFLVAVVCAAWSLSYRWSGWALSCFLSNNLSTCDVPSANHGWCQPGTLRPETSEWEILFPYLHFQIKPLLGTCVLTTTGHSNFSRNANKRATSVTGLNHGLGFTALSGSWLCFSVYLHNSSAYCSPSRSRSEGVFHACCLTPSTIVGSVMICWLRHVILTPKCRLQT